MCFLKRTCIRIWATLWDLFWRRKLETENSQLCKEEAKPNCLKGMKRDDLLSCVSEGKVDDLISLCKCGSRELEDVISSCSKKQLDQLWDGCQHICMESLLGLEGVDGTAEPGEGTELNQMLSVLQSLVSMAMATVVQDQLYVPSSLLESAIILHGMVLSLPETADKLKNNIAKLFEFWWSKNVEGREELAINTLLYLVERSLQFSAPLVEVKRVWSIHDILSLINLSDQSSSHLRGILTQCFMQYNYLKTDEGCRFLSFVLSLNVDFIDDVHKFIKNQLTTTPKSWIEKYGEVYFWAWQKADTAQAEKLETACIQDFMYHAVHGSRALFSILKRLLGFIHRQKKQKGVDDMLLRLYDPILWRSLKVANGNVRWNAVSLLMDVFPLQRPEENAEETDKLMQKQFDMFMNLLDDPCPSVRNITVFGVCKIMSSFWEMMPSEILRSFISKLIQDLVWDVSSAEVRESVFKGMAVLLDNHLCHLLLKPILPELKNFIHDTSEKVRIAMADLLLRVERLRTIKFWNIVSVEHLLARLESDSTPVVKRIMKLLFTSFIPLDQPSSVLVSRCIILIESNSVAARKFYQNASQYMPIHEVARYMTLLCRYILECLRSKQDDNGNPEDNSEDEEGDMSGGGEGSKISIMPEMPVLLGILEAIVILWTGIVEKLEMPENTEIKESLNKKFGLAVPEMLKSFEDPKICAALILLGSYLPSSCVQYLSRSCLSKLRNMTLEDKQDYTPLLEACCKWGRSSDVLELIGDWLRSALVPKTKQATDGGKKKKSVGFVDPVEPQPELALEYLSYLTTHPVCQNILLGKCRGGLQDVKNTLKCVLNSIEDKMREDEIDGLEDSFLSSALVLYCNLSIILHSTDNSEGSSLQTFKELISWTDVELLGMFGGEGIGNETEIEHKRKKRMLCSMNVTLIPSPGEDTDENSDMEGRKKQRLLNRTNLTMMESPAENSEELPGSQRMTRKRSMHKVKGNAKNLAYSAAKVVLDACRDMLLIGVGSVELASHVADLCTRCLQADRELKLLPEVLSCLHQVTEYVLIQHTTNNNGNGFHGSAIPGFLSRLMTSLASHLRVHRDEAPQILGAVRSHMLEILMAIFRNLVTEERYLREVMSTLVTSVVVELANQSEKAYLIHTPDSLSELPPLTAWLVDIVGRKAYLSKLFVKELSSCFESGAATELHKVHGGVHLLATLIKCKPKLCGLKECWEILHSEVAKLDLTSEEMNTDEEDTKKVCIMDTQEVKIFITDKLRECEQSLQGLTKVA
ncbi:hypothetical protein ScPMuIL_013218 [Solemya velum]